MSKNEETLKTLEVKAGRRKLPCGHWEAIVTVFVDGKAEDHYVCERHFESEQEAIDSGITESLDITNNFIKALGTAGIEHTVKPNTNFKHPKVDGSPNPNLH